MGDWFEAISLCGNANTLLVTLTFQNQTSCPKMEIAKNNVIQSENSFFQVCAIATCLSQEKKMCSTKELNSGITERFSTSSSISTSSISPLALTF